MTIEQIKADDIADLDEYGRKVFNEIEEKCNDTFSTAERKAIVGSYYNNAGSFKIEKGEKILLEKVVTYTSEKLRENGYNHFSVEKIKDLNIEQSNISYLEARGKFVFIEKAPGKVRNDLRVNAGKKSVSISRVTKQSTVSANVLEKPNCEQSETTEASSNATLTDTIKITFINRLDNILKKSNRQIDDRFADNLRKCMRNITLTVIYSDEGNKKIKAARITCFCGASYTIQWVETKKEGYFKYFNWDRHIKGHIPTDIGQDIGVNGIKYRYFK